MTIIKTERLILRPWKETDLEPFADLNADPRVMEYFPYPFSKKQSYDIAEFIKLHMETKGWGIWAVSVPEIADFIGFIGLYNVDPSTFPAPFAPAIAIGYRLAFNHWGKGYATEGAKAVLAYGFNSLKLKEIVAFTAKINIKSRRIMEKIGMTYDPKDDFDYPQLPPNHPPNYFTFSGDHPLKRHVVYRIHRSNWMRPFKLEVQK